MCGIIGYTGSSQAAEKLIGGLKRLEYRGYDSSGIAVYDKDTSKISVVKAEGKVEVLEKKTDCGKLLQGSAGIGHTRWATHGVPSDINAHPHASNDGRFAIVHNGIIENFFELKNQLTKSGYKFDSDTDSEVIVHLIEDLYNGDMTATLVEVMKKVEGSYAIGVVTSVSPDTLYAIRKDNPLVVGLGKGENFIASDVSAALEYTHKFVLLGNREIAAVSPTEVKFFDGNGKAIEKQPYTVKWDITQAEKGGYPHFMIKEIHEQPKAITDTVRPRIKANNDIYLDGLEFTGEYINSLEGIDIVGCGSAYHAGIVGKYFIEKYCRIRVENSLASEYIYSDPITGKNRLTIIISQSGETADTLAALRLAKSKGSRTVAVVNVVESAIAREADGVLYTHAGPEIAVATTKGYTTQIAALYLIGLKIAKTKNTITSERYDELVNAIKGLPEIISSQLSDAEKQRIRSLAKKYYDRHCAFFIGRGADYAASLEGALKLKEISYIHAEAYAAGELKHGTISLIEPGTITLALVTQSSLYSKMESNIKSVSSRKGTVIAITSPENAKIRSAADKVITIPECDDDLAAIPVAVVLQLFAYFVADCRKCDIDKPRNLAKSVTVE